MTVTREKLLSLIPGEKTGDALMTVRRGRSGTDHPQGDTLYLFRIEFQEGPLDNITDRYQIEDLLPEPWDLIKDEILRRAKKGKLHYQNGDPV